MSAQGARVFDLEEYRRRREASYPPPGSRGKHAPAPQAPLVWVPVWMWVPFWPILVR